MHVWYPQLLTVVTILINTDFAQMSKQEDSFRPCHIVTEAGDSTLVCDFDSSHAPRINCWPGTGYMRGVAADRMIGR